MADRPEAARSERFWRWLYGRVMAVHETYETTRPWVVYSYFVPDWLTRILGGTTVRMECCICGNVSFPWLAMPRFGKVPEPVGGRHSVRLAYLAAHEHRLQQRAPETWERPLRNIAAHNDLYDILRDVAEKARKTAS